MTGTWLARVGLLALLMTSMSQGQLLAQDLDAFGLEAELPEGWTFHPDHIDLEHNFGVFFAESEDGGFFWLQVMNQSGGNDTESPLADSSLTAGFVMNPIEFADEIAGFADGFVVENRGVQTYFFVSAHKGRIFRFRIGYNFEKADFDPAIVLEGQETLQKLVKSIRFTA